MTDDKSMKVDRFPIAGIEAFTAFDRSYAHADARLLALIPTAPTRESLLSCARHRMSANIPRPWLTEILEDRYQDVDIFPALKENLENLRSGRALTVTTAHQPILFGGPMYVLYKALTTLSLAREMTSWIPDQPVVPVFVLGSEDHDYEEVRHARIFSDRLTWESGSSGGPVGRMGQGNLPELVEQVLQLIQTLPHLEEVETLLRSSYRTGEYFSRSAFRLLHGLLGPLGLVILDFDHPAAKAACIPFLSRELTEHFSHDPVREHMEKLETVGFTAQASPREINLFYLSEGRRDRIVPFRDGGFQALGLDRTWSRDGILSELTSHPERFSPNVILRPLMQEWLLPNVAYIGGGGELAYWCELPGLFKRAGVPFPVLVRRHSGLLTDPSAVERLSKLGLEPADLFRPVHEVIHNYVAREDNLSADLTEERTRLTGLFADIQARCQAIDPTLVRSAESIGTQIDNLFQSLEGKMAKGLKSRHEQGIQQIRSLMERLMPNGSLQERQDSFLSWIARFGTTWIPDLLDQMIPLSAEMMVYRIERDAASA